MDKIVGGNGVSVKESYYVGKISGGHGVCVNDP